MWYICEKRDDQCDVFNAFFVRKSCKNDLDCFRKEVYTHIREFLGGGVTEDVAVENT